MPEEFSLKIGLGNDGMQSPSDLADALEDVAKRIRRDALGAGASGVVTDINGNRIGEWFLE